MRGRRFGRALLNLCSYHKIYIWNVTIHDNVYELQIRIKRFSKNPPDCPKNAYTCKNKKSFWVSVLYIFS